jgi:selenide, water dikinase
MHDKTGPVLRDIVLVGGGHAHVFVLKRFAMSPLDGVRLTVVSPDSHTPYSGMLPGFIAGHYTYDEAHIDLATLCQFAGARFLRDKVVGLDLSTRKVLCAGRPPISYDVLSLDIGSTPDPAQTPGAAGNVIPVKPVSAFLPAWESLKERVRQHPTRRIGIVGAGAGGVELALASQFALRQMLAREGVSGEPEFHVVTGGVEILMTHNKRVRNIFERVLAERHITTHLDYFVERVTTDGLEGNAGALPLDEIFWVTGADAAPWVKASGLAVDDRGFMRIDTHLQSLSHPAVFGAGDIATIDAHPRPKAGVFAVRQGPSLADNLRWTAMGRGLGTFKPQNKFLSLISTGDKYAVASWGDRAMEGEWVWRWKDWIDRRFMTKFNDLPEMQPEAETFGDDAVLISDEERNSLGDLTMRCGGCGAKVGAPILHRALNTLSPNAPPGVILGADARDDAAVFAVPQGKALVQTVDAFRAMIDDPYVFGRITANHCLGDIYAMGATPHVALAIATLPVALPKKTEALLSDMMAGADRVLREAGCGLLGGHTGEGTELSFGFSITGLVDPAAITSKTGLAADQAVILTKPLGTGVLFAANMRLKAKGRWIEGAIETACQSSREAAEIFRSHGATAMTDVTGFGLLGHLNEMIGRSPTIGVTLTLETIPALDGALEMIRAGITSSLAVSNRDALNTVANANEVEADDRLPLLIDPQTAGGLLASVPRAQACACLDALHATGYGLAAQIGETTARISPLGPVTIRR